MWPIHIVVLTPGFDLFLCIMQAGKDMLVEAFVPELSVETLDVGILGRLPWLNKVQFNPVFIGPGIHRLTDEFGPVVDGNDFGQTPG